jgi:NTP pyrophosphatase (non-canonical NTP hydrolase)
MTNADEYQRLALRTLNPDLTPSEQLQDGLMGLCGEAGECIDLLKKHMFQGHAEIDKEHLAKELGDVAWYLAVSANTIGYKLSEIFEINIEKLWKRYPKGFDSIRSGNRAEGDI